MADELRVISADVAKAAGPLNTMFRRCVGAGRAAEGLRAGWRRQLTIARAECGFENIRFHGLFNDDMGVCVRAGGGLRYNWQYLDDLFDFLVAVGVKPFVEFGFMPPALASGTRTIFWWKGNVTPPKCYDEWDDLIRALTAHWIERYGADEVRTWFFEVWNEPNLDGFWWPGEGQSLFDEYMLLCAHTVRAVKSVDPALMVGGPATAGCSWIKETIDYAVANNVPLDFLSTHRYSVQDGDFDEYGKDLQIMRADRHFVANSVRKLRALIDASPRPHLKLHMTEWGASYSPRDPVHDSYFMAAFILEQLKATGAAAASMSYWVFTDIFEEAGVPTMPFHGGFGLMNLQGIRKPAYFAYLFLNRLGRIELVNADEHSYVCTDGKGGVQALIWDLRIPNQGVPNQVFFRQDHPAQSIGSVELRVCGLTPGTYDLQITRVGYRANDAYSVYLADFGRPDRLTKAQAERLDAVANGAPELSEQVTIGADGVFSRQVPMRELDCVLVRVQGRT